jgi:hypothetical protein
VTTVPKADTPPPANNAQTTLLQSDPNIYVRPTAGGNVSGTIDSAPGSMPGQGGPGAGAGAVPGYSINWAGNPPSVGGTQVGADIGSGSTILAGQPDATGHPDSDVSGGGTVGYSGPQQAGPGPTPNSPSGMPDMDRDGDSL